MVNSILHGDCIQVMKTLEEKSIDVIITSPPYFQQRDYEVDGQIGNETCLDSYISAMTEWSKQCLRILKDTGSLFLNIGDKYEKKGLLMIPEKVCIAICGSGWILRNKIVWYKPNHMPSSVSDRFCSTWEPIYFFTKNSDKYYSQEYFCNLDLLRQPSATQTKLPFPKFVAIEDFEEISKKVQEFNETKKTKGKFKNAGINKGASPGARQQCDISYSKMRKHTFTEAEELEVHSYLKQKAKDKKLSAKKLDEMFGYKSKAGHWLRLDHGRSMPSVEDYKKLKEYLELDDSFDRQLLDEHYVLQSVQNNPKGKAPEDLWSIPLKHEKGIEHFAMFPIELPLKIIAAFCPPDGVVLDPFAGSGTTGLAAKSLHRSSVLIELNPQFVELIQKRMNE
jgi:DNA modification methylase